MRNYIDQLNQSELPEHEAKKVAVKRVSIVSLKVVKEANLLYKGRHIRSSKDRYELIRPFLEDAAREMFIVMALDIKKQPTSIQTCHSGSLNASLVYPREVLKITGDSHSYNSEAIEPASFACSVFGTLAS